MASFSCSKCKLPISLSAGLAEPSQTTYDVLRSATNASTRFPRPQQAYPQSREALLNQVSTDLSKAAMTKRTSRHDDLSDVHNTAESFVILQTSSTDESSRHHRARDSLSDNLEAQRKLFDLLSGVSEIDHPLCQECTDLLIQEMNKTMLELDRDRKSYIAYLNKSKDEIPSTEAHEMAAIELKEMSTEMQSALEELRSAETQRADIEADLAQLRKESQALDLEEEAFWRERNKVADEIESLETERYSIDLRLEHDSKELERLQRTNVYNDTFHIGHDGNFGTINGLRLGRLSNYPVSWEEINAAWGLTLLLLQTMAEKLDYKFRGYKLIPMGSTSRIERIELQDNAAKVMPLDLFGSTDVNPLKFLQRNSFDKAMVAFLECLRQLGDHAEGKDPTVVMPYKIDRDKISDACIRTAFNQDEAWTRALKFCLTNLKWILAVVARAQPHR